MINSSSPWSWFIIHQVLKSIHQVQMQIIKIFIFTLWVTWIWRMCKCIKSELWNWEKQIERLKWEHDFIQPSNRSFLSFDSISMFLTLILLQNCMKNFLGTKLNTTIWHPLVRSTGGSNLILCKCFWFYLVSSLK